MARFRDSSDTPCFKQYKGRPFKVAQFRSWFVVISGQKLVDDLRLASDNELSLQHAMDEVRDVALGRDVALTISSSNGLSRMRSALTWHSTTTTSKLSVHSSRKVSKNCSLTSEKN